ncbi:MAG: Snf7 family protein [Candidatus Melainabacteria bacterium]|nr:Snf7 family protein [Candidatus Melainabacteria bacterium]
MVSTFDKIQELEQQISKWRTRAEMAHKQGSKDLVRSALKEKRHFQKLLNELRGTIDDHPQNARVPLKKSPDAGSGEIALPLPEASNE